MRSAVVIVVVLVLTSVVSAQSGGDVDVRNISRSNGFGVRPAPSPFSLLDLSRVRWSHSYSVSFFAGGYGSGSVGMLNSSMFYELSPKLSLSFNLGILHNVGAVWGSGNSSATFLPGFVLDYHPSDRFQMSIGLQHYSGYFSPYAARNRFWLTR